jgi:WD40 repeat protein
MTRRSSISGSKSQLLVWNLDADNPPRLLEGHTDAITAVALSADGNRVLSGFEDNILMLWDLDRNWPPGLLRGHEQSVTAVAFSPCAWRIVISPARGHVTMFHTLFCFKFRLSASNWIVADS